MLAFCLILRTALWSSWWPWPLRSGGPFCGASFRRFRPAALGSILNWNLGYILLHSYIYIYSFALFTLHIYLYALNVLHYLYCSSHIPCSILFTFHSIYIFYCTNLIIVYYIVLYFIIVVFFCVSIVSYDLYYHVLYYCMIAYCFRLILLQYIIFLSYCML